MTPALLGIALLTDGLHQKITYSSKSREPRRNAQKRDFQPTGAAKLPTNWQAVEIALKQLCHDPGLAWDCITDRRFASKDHLQLKIPRTAAKRSKTRFPADWCSQVTNELAGGGNSSQTALP